MKYIAAITVVTLLASTPAFATDKSNPNQSQNTVTSQSQSQTAKGGTGVGIGVGGNSKSSSSSGAIAGSNSEANSRSNSGGNEMSDNSDHSSSTDAFGFAYVDSAITVPMAAALNEYAVTSQNLKVLGPIFGYAWQSMEIAPQGMGTMIGLVNQASENDRTDAGRSRQSSALAVLCTYKPELADARFGEDACDRINEIVSSTN